MVKAITMQFVILGPCRRIILKTCTQYQCIAQKTQIRNQLPNVEFAFYPAVLLLMLAIVVLQVLTIANLRLVPATSYECNIPVYLNNTCEQNSCVIEEQAEQLSKLLITVDEQCMDVD